MKILYASDTHVHPAHFDRLLKAAELLGPDAVIIGGDIIPDWKKTIAASIEPHRSWVREKLLPSLMKFHRDHPQIPVLLDLGNDDIAAARPLLEERDGAELHLLHMRVVGLGEKLAVAGYMNVNPTPFRIKDYEKPDCRDLDGLSDAQVLRFGSKTASGKEAPYMLDPAAGTIEDDLDTLSRLLEGPKWQGFSFLFVSHAPPKNTALDRTAMGFNVGSLAIRRFIEKWNPTGRLIASFHGHIHESPWKSGRAWQPLGLVPCFNAGQKPRVLHAVLIETNDPSGSARPVRVDEAGRVRVLGPDEWLDQ